MELNTGPVDAQRDRLIKERDALIEACSYLIGLRTRRQKLKLAFLTFMLRFKSNNGRPRLD